MRYFYKKPDVFFPIYDYSYSAKHPVYDTCTLFVIKDKGLAIVQQRFDPIYKMTWWEHIDPWLANDIYLHPRFGKYFEKKAGLKDENGFYPTVTVRQIMWGLRMRPLKKERWETVFDRQII